VSSEGELPVDPRVERLLEEVLRPLLEADGGSLHAVRRLDDGYVLEVGGSMAGCPALELTQRHVLDPAFEKALGERVRVVLEIRPSPR
jgi:Fe-S cluster biogenesis protein NfuA